LFGLSFSDNSALLLLLESSFAFELASSICMQTFVADRKPGLFIQSLATALSRYRTFSLLHFLATALSRYCTFSLPHFLATSYNG
jgi:hypothetical protein